MSRYYRWGLLVGLGLFGGASFADDGPISISGFGTLAANYHNASGATFRRDFGQGRGANAGSVSLVSDSMLGVQLAARPTQALEATLQLVSRQSVDGNFNPDVSWGYLKYKFDEATSVRAGRMNGDLYLQGDSAEIGYANLQVRQPIILYPRYFDGLDGDVTRPVGDATLRFKVQGGWNRGMLVNWGDPYDCGGSRVLGALAEYVLNGWTARFSAVNLRMKNETVGANYQALVTGLAMAPNGAAILDKIAMRNRLMEFRSLALGYDSGPWQASGSYSLLATDGWGTRKSITAVAGYRMDQFTPYVSYAHQRSPRNFISSGIPNGLSPATDALNQGAAVAQTGVLVNQTDTALGVRYDFARNMALKLQVDRIRYQDPEAIYDPQIFQGSIASRGFKSMTLYSLALDFVF